MVFTWLILLFSLDMSRRFQLVLIQQSVPQTVNMDSVLSSTQSLMQMFQSRAQEFMNEIDDVHMVWLEEIQQEANRMFSR